MAPLVACMRSETAMLHEASTAKRMRLEGAPHAHLALQIVLAQRPSHSAFGAVRLAFLLVRRGGAQRGVKGDVVSAAVGGPRLDVAATLALGFGARATPGALARQAVERRIQLARCELGLAFDLLAALPPIGILLVKDVLRGRFCLTEVRQLFIAAIAQGLAFFLAACSSLSALASEASSPSLHSDMTCSS